MSKEFLEKIKKSLFLKPQKSGYKYSIVPDNGRKILLQGEALNYTDYIWKKKTYEAIEKFLAKTNNNLDPDTQGYYPMQVFETKSICRYEDFINLLAEEEVNIVTKKHDNTNPSGHSHVFLGIHKDDKFMVEGSVYQRSDDGEHFSVRLEITYLNFNAIANFISKLNDLRETFASSNKSSNKMFFMQKDPSVGNIFFKKVSHMGQPLPEENYNDEVVKNYHYCIDKLKDKNKTAGRLVILRGKPGTGKTNLIKCFCHDMAEPMIFIPSYCINSLLGPDMLTLLSNFRSTYSINKKASLVLVLEDCDDFLESRSSGDSVNVSSLLNLCDGLVGEALDLKFIATTNLPNMQIDPAVTRAGRLMKVIDIEELSKDKANKLYKKLSNTTEEQSNHFKENVTLAEVYEEAAKLDNSSKDMKEKDKKTLGFATGK